MQYAVAVTYTRKVVHVIEAPDESVAEDKALMRTRDADEGFLELDDIVSMPLPEE